MAKEKAEVKLIKPKKNQGIIAWLFSYGIGVAYTLLLSLSISITKWIIIGLLFFIAWWEKIR